MFGKGRDITARERSQLIDALLTVSQTLHDEQARGMGHRLHHDGAIPGVLFDDGCTRRHIWQNRQI